MRRNFVRGISVVLGLFLVSLIIFVVFRPVAKPDKQEVLQHTSNSTKKDDGKQEDTDTIRLGNGARKNIILGKVESKPLLETIKASAEVSEDLKRFAKIHLRITGTVKEIYAWLGDTVDKGAPLLTVSSNELEDLVESYLTAKARYEAAGENYKRTKKLRSEEIVPEKALLEDRKEYLTSEVDVRRSREKLLLMGFNEQDIKDSETGKQKSSLYTVRSPIAGVIVKQDGAILGATISPDVELYEVLNTDCVWIFADVPPEIARNLKEGTKEKILISDDKAKPAKITYISSVVDDKTRTVKVRLEADNSDMVLRPGEFVEVEFQVPMEDTVPVVRKSALFLLDDKYVVFVPKDEGFVPKEVKTGIETDGFQEIKEGLSPGEEVVIDGGYYIKASILKEKIGEQD